MNQLTPAALCKSLADETRLHLVVLLARYGELCVCDLVSALALPQSTVSRHLAQLRAAGLMLSRREGQWVHYRLVDNLPDWADEVIAALCEGAAADCAELFSRAGVCRPLEERVS